MRRTSQWLYTVAATTRQPEICRTVSIRTRRFCGGMLCLTQSVLIHLQFSGVTFSMKALPGPGRPGA
jgi:hypothetical protein